MLSSPKPSEEEMDPWVDTACTQECRGLDTTNAGRTTHGNQNTAIINSVAGSGRRNMITPSGHRDGSPVGAVGSEHVALDSAPVHHLMCSRQQIEEDMAGMMFELRHFE